MTFALAGDAIITRKLSPYIDPEFLGLIDIIRGADVAFTNLEVLLLDFSEAYPAVHSGGTWISAEQAIAKELVWAGFDLVSRANNHTMDFMARGLRETSRALDGVGLLHAGAGENLAEARAPVYLETPGGRVAMISVSSTFSDEDMAGPQRGDMRGRPGLSPLRFTTTYEVNQETMDQLRSVAQAAGIGGQGEGPGGTQISFLGNDFLVGNDPGRHTRVHEGDLAEITAVVRDARRQADWVIISCHTHENSGNRHMPAEFLVEFAHAAVEAGADIFVGSGPHVMRGVEIYQGKPIFYSLADFLFQNETLTILPSDMYDKLGLPPSALPGEVQDARIRSSQTGGFPADRSIWESVVAVPTFIDGVLDEIRLYPITLGFGLPRPQRGRPVLANASDGRRLIEEIAGYSASFGVEIFYDAIENVGIIRP